MVDDPVLQEDIVCGEGNGPSCCCRGQERHWDAETDFGSHCVCVWGFLLMGEGGVGDDKL